MKEKLMKSIEFIKRFVNTNKALCMKIIAGMIIIIAILVIASCFKGTKYGNSVGNNSNLGLTVQDGKWIYYVEVDDNEPVGICKVKTNGKKTKKIADGYMYNLNIIDNYIYCLEYDEEDGQNNLIKIKTNGKNKEILASDIDETQILVAGKWVYYSKNDNLYRVKLNGTDIEKISEKMISYYQIEENWIYYIYEKGKSEYIAKMKLNGEDSQRISKADSEEIYEALYVKNGRVYYIVSKMDDSYDSQYYLYRMSKKGEKVEQICKLDTNIQFINMQDDRIYYTVTEDYNNDIIKSIKYNGTDKQTIKKSKSASNINITKDWILFIGINEDYDNQMKMIRTDGEKEKNL